MVAWTWKDDFHLRESLNDIRRNLEAKRFGKTPDKVILQCLGAIIQKTAKTRDILSLKPEVVRDSIEILNNSSKRL